MESGVSSVAMQVGDYCQRIGHHVISISVRCLSLVKGLFNNSS